jgi:hypothetical protein
MYTSKLEGRALKAPNLDKVLSTDTLLTFSNRLRWTSTVMYFDFHPCIFDLVLRLVLALAGYGLLMPKRYLARPPP